MWLNLVSHTLTGQFVATRIALPVSYPGMQSDRTGFVKIDQSDHYIRKVDRHSLCYLQPTGLEKLDHGNLQSVML